MHLVSILIVIGESEKKQEGDKRIICFCATCLPAYLCQRAKATIKKRAEAKIPPVSVVKLAGLDGSRHASLTHPIRTGSILEVPVEWVAAGETSSGYPSSLWVLF